MSQKWKAKSEFWIFKKNSYCIQNGVNASFWAQNQFKSFLKILSVGFLKFSWKWLFGFLRNVIFLGARMQQYKHFTKSVHYNFLRFYMRKCIQKEVKVTFFHFLGQPAFCPKNHSLYIFGCKIDIFHISCFTALIFQIA